MSSMETTSNTSEKRGTFLTRSSSFQKFKCSATYQFHLAGSKLSKETLTQLFEKVITRSRTLLSLSFVVLASSKIFGMVIYILAEVFGLNLIIGNESTAKLQAPASGLLVRIQRTKLKTDEDRLKPEVPFKYNLFKIISNFQIFNDVKQKLYLSICVYCCVALVYMQLMVLLIALNVSSTPPGLIFLSFSVFFIFYLIYKLFTKSEPHYHESTLSTKPTSPERFRISRSTTRRYLEFHEKTLSKIKLV